MKTILNISDTADYILSNYSSKDYHVTHLKLQKLLYYLKVWGLVSNQFEIDGSFKKWKYGPVNEKIYQDFKEYGSDIIPTKVTIEETNIPLSVYEILNFIIKSHIHFSAFTLSDMTHLEYPWVHTKLNQTISDDLIKKYYSSKPFAKNFDDNFKGYIPIATNASSSYLFDFQSDKMSSVVFNTIDEYLKSFKEQNEFVIDKLKTLEHT